MDIGNSLEEYNKFAATVGDASEVRRVASFFVVIGDVGCGKTAFLHRCVSLLRDVLGPDAVVLLNLSHEARFGVEARVQVDHVARRVVDLAASEGNFSSQDQERLDRKAEDPHQMFPFLADLLHRSGQHGVVILPPVEVAETLRIYANLARPGLTFFVETSNIDLTREAHLLNTVARLSLHRLTPLRMSDGWRFIEARLGAQPAPIRIRREAAVEYMRTRIRGQGQISIRELELTCRHVYADAMARAASEIDFSDFQNYYIRRGVLR
ncbi:hypothetical protein AB0C07_14615 [Actinoplanes missouriensis]|uniref:hypothetical protein n=1 Tax=Actinoplanes missouriensis TaxID=1866 RepID=UPI00340FCC76